MSCISDTKLNALQKLKLRAKFLVENTKCKDGWICEWLPVKELIRYDRLVMTHKILRGSCPDNLQKNYKHLSTIPDKTRRDKRVLRQKMSFLPINNYLSLLNAPSPCSMLVDWRKHTCELIYDISIGFQHWNWGGGVGGGSQLKISSKSRVSHEFCPGW